MNGKTSRILCTVPVATAALIMAVQESKGSPIPNGGIFGGGGGGRGGSSALATLDLDDTTISPTGRLPLWLVAVIMTVVLMLIMCFCWVIDWLLKRKATIIETTSSAYWPKELAVGGPRKLAVLITQPK